MRICQVHWDKLRQALKDRGIDHLGAKDAQQVTADMKAQIEGEETAYDPLMSCNWMIWSQGLQSGGPYLLTKKEDGSSYCPICEALEHTPLPVTFADDSSQLETKEQHEKWWIEGPADAALNECRKRGLVPGTQ